ncbi:unnamed protein product [Brassica oleracea var. botrytis]
MKILKLTVGSGTSIMRGRCKRFHPGNIGLGSMRR